MNIEEIIALLRPIEEEACAVYAALARRFPKPPGLTALLRTLSRDEAAHLRMLNAAARQLAATAPETEATLQFSAEESRRMHTALSTLRERAENGHLGETQLLEAIIDAEFSEWNEMFLYIVAQFRQQGPDFQHFASVIHQHRRHIEEYLSSRPAEVRPPNAARALPRVWEERILVADDNDALRLVFGEFLGRFGNVSTAADGAAALALARQNFFDVIVSDVDMPGLDGLQLFDAVTALTPAERSRFIFVTGLSRPRLEQLQAKGLARVLLKPMSLTALEEAVSSVLKNED